MLPRALCEARHPVHTRARARHLAGAPQTIKVQRKALEHAPEGREGTPLVAEVVRKPTGIGARGLRIRPPRSPFLLIEWPKRGAWHHGKMLSRTVGNSLCSVSPPALNRNNTIGFYWSAWSPPKKLLLRLSWRTGLGIRVGKRA